MYLVELFLPLADNEGKAFPASRLNAVRKKLTAAFGGLTAFTRAPAEGTEKQGHEERQDSLIVFEVMAETLDRQWWEAYRSQLETEFRQDRILVRASEITLL